MTAFHEVRFPDSIAYGATGGPVWSTTIAALSTGAEQRYQNWVNARHRWNVATGIKRLADFHQVLRFFQAGAAACTASASRTGRIFRRLPRPTCRSPPQIRRSAPGPGRIS